MGGLLDMVFQRAGFGDFTNDAVAQVIGAVVIGVNVVGLITAIAIAVPRLRAHRTAAWIPLLIGVVCVLLTTGLLVGAAASDPAFIAQLGKR